jgi:mono/diheme cytochrome c family protein
VRRLARGALAAAASSLLAAAAAGAGESPRVLYMLHCQGCHLADGSGRPGEVPPLAGALGRLAAVPGGRAYLVQVPGSASSPLSDAELAAVLNWVLRAFAPAPAAPPVAPYDAAEVARYRTTPLVDVAGARAELLRRLGGGAAQ